MRPINWRRPPPSLTQLRSMTVNFPALFPPSFFSLLLVLFAWLFYITWCLLLWGFAAGWGHRLRAVHFCVLWSEYCLLYFYVCVYIYSVCESRKRTVCVRVGGGCEGRGRTVYECVNVYVCVCALRFFFLSFLLFFNLFIRFIRTHPKTLTERERCRYHKNWNAIHAKKDKHCLKKVSRQTSAHPLPSKGRSWSFPHLVRSLGSKMFLMPASWEGGAPSSSQCLTFSIPCTIRKVLRGFLPEITATRDVSQLLYSQVVFRNQGLCFVWNHRYLFFSRNVTGSWIFQTWTSHPTCKLRHRVL